MRIRGKINSEKKNIISVSLNRDLIDKLDEIAIRKNIPRSNLYRQILTDYIENYSREKI